MKYAIITPVFNEESSVGALIDCMKVQQLRPDLWILYDDGSRDRTAEIIREKAEGESWIRLVQNTAEKKHMAGGNIARIFNHCYRSYLEQGYDFIGKLDADLSFGPDYFSSIAGHFSRDEKLAICGGVCLVEAGGEWVIEKITNKDHVRGALKCYRRSFLELIGGLREIDGWDAVDEMLAKFNGLKVLADIDLQVKHYRPTDRKTGHLKAHKMTGRGCYFMGFNLFAALISCSKRIKYRPPLIGPFAAYGTYLSMFFSKEKRVVTRAEARFISRLVIRNAMKKVFG
jgi:glycosyltransferase involved in cell wall biosynthesis